VDYYITPSQSFDGILGIGLSFISCIVKFSQNFADFAEGQLTFLEWLFYSRQPSERTLYVVDLLTDFCVFNDFSLENYYRRIPILQKV